jgi:hypothetical protein
VRCTPCRIHRGSYICLVFLILAHPWLHLFMPPPSATCFDSTHPVRSLSVPLAPLY